MLHLMLTGVQLHSSHADAKLLASLGFHRFLDAEETELREKGAKLNPKTFPKPRKATGQQPAPEYRAAAALPPTEKTSAFMMQAARESDQACAAGVKRKSKTHPLHQTGVHASHAMQKVPGYDDRGTRNPEPMHTIGNEVSSVTVMAMGGTAAIYSVARLKEVAQWETDLNSNGRSSRWLRQLRPYLTGILLVGKLMLCVSNDAQLRRDCNAYPGLRTSMDKLATVALLPTHTHPPNFKL